MKKIICIALTLTFCAFAFVGCDKNKFDIYGQTLVFEYGDEFFFDGEVKYNGKTLASNEYWVDFSYANAHKTGEYDANVVLSDGSDYVGYKIKVIPKKSLSLLMVGNSFSVDTIEYAYPIARSAGIENIELGNLYVGGCDIDSHLAYIKANNPIYVYFHACAENGGVLEQTEAYNAINAIKATDWEIITFQQASHLSGTSSTYGKLADLKAEVLKYATNEKVKMYFNATWAYASDCTHKYFANYRNNQTYMYESIMSAVYGKVYPQMPVIPVGTAVQNGRLTYLGDTFNRDGRHLTYDIGRYTAGLTLVAAVTGINVDDVTFCPDGIDKKAETAIKQAVKDAIESPFGVTESVYAS